MIDRVFQNEMIEKKKAIDKELIANGMTIPSGRNFSSLNYSN